MKSQSGWFYALILIASLLIVGVCFVFAPKSHANDEAEANAIRQAMMHLFHRPENPLDVSPIAIEGDAAVAGWTQQEMGGRAFLRKRHGKWTIVLCSGDQLKSTSTLRTAGLSAAQSEALAAKLAKEESNVAPVRLALFAKFDGLVNVESASDHQTPTGHQH